ncbi:metal binding Ada-like protein [Actinomycetospora succinea]|uniref:Metal binding Ada-like protein n=1 Tax=Actinomycetospora succinea TaxID=663603 RepID=A0A4R6VMX3_9PSEU|nr:Ada metal-binding domain-containing protein [Actinomycetospora succinea]TDQ65192.1 metal binding Ada-like protein [Actinomycetospora succinea]
MTPPATPDVPARTYRLVGADGRPYLSSTPGAWGGHRRQRIYGRLDCPSALRWLARGHYARHRVFFADEATARAAGYRPCAVCLPGAYRRWAGARADTRQGTAGTDEEAPRAGRGSPRDRGDRAATGPTPPGFHPTTDAPGTAHVRPGVPVLGRGTVHEQEER